MVAALSRGWLAWRAAARRARAWTQLARPLSLNGATLPLYAVDCAAPIMALAGVFRPRLLITRGVFDALTEEEVRAGVAHELGHWRARDNLKRLVMRAAPDLLVFTHAAAALESRWASAAEHAADGHAGADAPSRCALASALVKIARLTPPATPLGEPISTLVDGGEIASRVERLLSDGGPAAPSSRRWSVVVAGASLAAGAAAAYGPLLRLVHEATELLLHALP